MKNKLFIAYSLIFLSGCATNFKMDENVKETGFLKFNRDAITPLLGSTTTFHYIENETQCDDELMKSTRLATLDEGNPLISDYNANGTKVPAKKNTTILIIELKGIMRCSNTITFDVEPDEEYTVNAFSDSYVYNGLFCYATVTDSKGNEIKNKYYEICNLPDQNATRNEKYYCNNTEIKNKNNKLCN